MSVARHKSGSETSLILTIVSAKYGGLGTTCHFVLAYMENSTPKVCLNRFEGFQSQVNQRLLLYFKFCFLQIAWFLKKQTREILTVIYF